MSTRDAIALAQRYDKSLTEMEDAAVKIVDRALTTAYRQLEKEIRTKWPTLKESPIISRDAIVAQQLGAYLDLLKDGGYEDAIANLIEQASLSGEVAAVDMVDQFDHEMASIIQGFADVPIEAIAAQAKTANDRLKRHSQEFRDKATAIIGTNLAMGRGVGPMAKDLRNQLGVTRGKAEAIARTETITAFDRASQQRYEDAGLFSQVFSVGDRRVCPFCAYRNGKVYRTRDIVLPLHPSDRCYRSPWSKNWQTLGLTDDAFVKQYASDGVAELAKEGKAPNPGLAPFERGVRQSPPRPIWSP